MIGKLFNSWAMKVQVREASDFASRLKSMNSDELGMPLALTLEAAQMALEDRNIDVFDPFSAISIDPAASLFFSQMVIKLQKDGRNELAPGAMVWAHTLRATMNHKSRNIVREIWSELNRGEPYVEDARDYLLSAYSIWPSLDRAGETPVGMEMSK